MSDRLDQLLQLHKNDPADAFLTYAVALEHVKTEQFDDAITWLDRTIERDRGYCYAYFQKAKAQSQLGDDEDALATLKVGRDVARETGDEKALGELIELTEMLE